MLQGSCSILHTGLEPIAPFTRLMWDLPYDGEQTIENRDLYQEQRRALNAESNRYHLSYFPPQVKAFDAHKQGREAVSAAVADVLEPLFRHGLRPEFELLESHSVRSHNKSKLYMTGLAQIKRDLVVALSGMAGIMLGGSTYTAGQNAAAMNELLAALIAAQTDEALDMLRNMCAQMYYKHLKHQPWFPRANHKLKGETKLATLHKLRKDVPREEHYSLFSAIEDSNRDVFGMSTDGANPGDILRMMN
jgi:hypothetical protein